jgi:nitroreductase
MLRATYGLGNLFSMELFEGLYTRRSIRKYRDEPVPAYLVEKVLGAAMMAPSAGDDRPWHFIVVDSKDEVAAIQKALPHAEPAVGAPLAILVCADTTVEKFPNNWMLDCSAATENLLLAAHGLGLGAVWIAVWPFDEFVAGERSHFGIPDHVQPLALVIIGYPGEEVPSEDRYDASRVHPRRW